jgi:hypothetical protein
MGAAGGLVLVWFALPGGAQSTRHVDRANHFEARIPAGWYPIQQSLVDAVDQELERRLAKKPFRYVSGYSTSTEGEMTYPYVLFQITEGPMNRTSEAELIRSFNAETWEGEALEQIEVFSDVMTDVELEVNWDATRRRMIMPTAAEVPGVGPMRGVAVARVGSHGLVQINCYARASAFDATMPVFQEWIDGVQIEDGYQWQPGSEGPIDWEEVGWMALVGGIVGGLGALIFGRLRRS